MAEVYEEKRAKPLPYAPSARGSTKAPRKPLPTTPAVKSRGLTGEGNGSAHYSPGEPEQQVLELPKFDESALEPHQEPQQPEIPQFDEAVTEQTTELTTENRTTNSSDFPTEPSSSSETSDQTSPGITSEDDITREMDEFNRTLESLIETPNFTSFPTSGSVETLPDIETLQEQNSPSDSTDNNIKNNTNGTSSKPSKLKSAKIADISSPRKGDSISHKALSVSSKILGNMLGKKSPSVNVSSGSGSGRSSSARNSGYKGGEQNSDGNENSSEKNGDGEGHKTNGEKKSENSEAESIGLKKSNSFRKRIETISKKSEVNTSSQSPQGLRNSVTKANSFHSTPDTADISTNISTEDALNMYFSQLDASKYDIIFENEDPSWLDMSKWPQRRDKIVLEIYTTELSYVRSLRSALALYRKPIQHLILKKSHISTISDSPNNSGIDSQISSLSNTDSTPLLRVDRLFQAMTDILNVNSVLLTSLRERLLAWSDSQMVGDVLVTLTPFLRMYKLYTMAYDDACQAINDVENSDKVFESLLKLAYTHSLAKGQSLQSFLILPVQRLPRYVMLLQDLVKNTEESHCDFKLLNKALGEMKTITDQINEAIKAAENRQKCVHIQDLLNFGNLGNKAIKLVAPHRVFIAEGTLIKQCRKERKPRDFYLFNDMLIYGFSTPTNYVVSAQMKLSSLTVINIPDEEESQFLNTIMIAGFGKSFHVFAESPEQKTFWLNTLKDAVAAHIKQKSTLQLSPEEGEDVGPAPVWAPDNTVVACTICDNKFTLIFRRHHCRSCGSVVCGECSKNNMIVPAVSKKTVRVCNNCFDNNNNKTT